MMRLLFLFVFVGGLALAAVPWFSENFLARDIGVWRVYDSATGYLPAQARLKSEDAPLNVLVDMTTVGPASLSDDRVVLTLTAAAGGQTVLAKALTFAHAGARDTNPQTGEKIFREAAGIIDPVEFGDYVFTLGEGDAEGVTVRSVDLILRRGGGAHDERIQPLGYALMAIGFIGLVLALRRGGGSRPQNPNSQPPPPRWGRGGAQTGT
jgi:hypothetical protein